MTEIEHCNVRKLIFDMFPPTKHINDKNLDTFTLPAKGLNDLPFHYFMNADHPCNSNVVAIPGVCDEFYYMSPVSSRKIKEGDELLWSSITAKKFPGLLSVLLALVSCISLFHHMILLRLC